MLLVSAVISGWPRIFVKCITNIQGNTWGQCEDGTSGLGCGPQEHFRTCSDISITWNVKEATGHVFEEFQPYLEDTPEEVIDY